MGKISKQILDRVNAKVITATAINQWKNTSSVIDWFKKIDNKKQHSFICFDTIEFYPSISEDLSNKALDFASAYDNITAEERNIVIQAKISLLTHKQQSSASIFDVTMGSFDGAETCELVGCFLLSQLKTKCGGKIGLYRDDGLAVSSATPGGNEGSRMTFALCSKSMASISQSKSTKKLWTSWTSRLVSTTTLIGPTLNLTPASYTSIRKATTPTPS